MEEFVLQYLENKENKKFKNLKFSPVPRGQKGDLALHFFELAKSEKKTPLVLAQIFQKLFEGADFLEHTEISGPYLNLFFKPQILLPIALQVEDKIDNLKGKNIVLEFSGPNTNKPLHLGHMRNHAIGMAMANILEAAGAVVHRVNIINDRGVHICKSMLAYQRFGHGETPESTGEKSDFFVGRYYVLFEIESKKDESLKDEVQKMLVAWEKEDKEVRALWEKMNGWALSGHAQTYQRQGVVFEKIYKESETYKIGKRIAEEGLKNGVFQKRADGAIVIDLMNEGLDEKVILRADNTSIYLTQDLAVAVLRNQDFHPDEMIYVVADEQNYHFQVLFLCLEKLGLLTRDKLTHLGYGLVNLPEGRMKSREGTVVDADNLMDELSGLAQEEITKRNPELDATEKKKIAEQIMNAAWKFYLLQVSPRKVMLFDPKKSIEFEGATGPYLQYAGVRIKSILRKVNERIPPEGKPKNLTFTDSDKPLAVKILEFSTAIENAAKSKNPTYIATYLLELAQEWSKFYEKNSVLNADSEGLKNARIALAQKVLKVMEYGLGLLGIEIPERM